MPRKRDKDSIIADLMAILRILPVWAGPPFALVVFLLMLLFSGVLRLVGSPWGPMFAQFFATLALPALLLVLTLWVVTLFMRLSRGALFHKAANTDAIRAMSWRDFELLVGEALRRDGYLVEERGGSAADGGVDLIARRGGETLLVQCKHWKTFKVGVKVVREMFGVLMAERATAVSIITTGDFTRDAVAFAEGKPITLMNGESLSEWIAELQLPAAASTTSPIQPPPQVGESSRPEATPCPKCGSPMVVRIAGKGPNTGNRFLGCSQFPRCSSTLPFVSE